jgi:energy-coupling factor transporter transmembrane protein EcfT
MSGGQALARRRQGVRTMGTGGYLACLVFAMVVAVLAQGWRLAIACGIVLLLAAVFFPKGLRVLTDRRFLLFLLFVLIPPALLLEPKALTLGFVELSQEGLAIGVNMALRATTIAVAVAGFSASVSVGELSRLLEQAGFKGLGFSLGVAMNILPIIRETIGTVYQALRLRGGFRRRRLHALRLLLVTIVVHTLRHADNIVDAAEARAFSPSRITSRPLALRKDIPVYAVLFVAAAALLLWP